MNVRFNLHRDLRCGTRFAFAACILLAMAGCRQDMHNQPKYVPYRSSEFFRDGLSERQPIPGTVARGELRENTYFYSGKVGVKEGDQFPFPITPAVMERGRERYDIYCSPCHSRVGDGNGMIVKRGYRQSANLHEKRYIDQPVGHYYDVITNGRGAMPEYASQIEPTDRWAIAAYIRALQYAQSGSLADVPADQRGELKDASQITVGGVSLQQAISAGGKGAAEDISTTGANPAAPRPRQNESPEAQPQEGTPKK